MISVLVNFPPLPTQPFSQGLSFKAYGEDLYFVVGLLTLNSNSNSNSNIYNVGLDEYATKFCTHTHYLHDTFCVHKLDNYVNDVQLNDFLEYCPEFNNFLSRA